jgi:hypothetical protein
MAPHQAPERVSVPRPSHVPSSYPEEAAATSGDPGSRVHFTGISPPDWLTHDVACSALVRAARRAGRPLDADQLARAADIHRRMSTRLRDQLLDELARGGDLVVIRRQNPRALWERIVLYAAPTEARG